VVFRLDQVAATHATVLLQGETGTVRNWWRARFIVEARDRPVSSSR
jgi:DNA-binding NtrC family response regulator